MEVKLTSQDQAVVKMDETLKLSNSKEFKKQMLDLINRGIKKVTLDFTATSSIDSSGLGKLLFFAEILDERGGGLEIVNVGNRELRSLFELLNLDQAVKINYKEVG